MLTLVFPIAGYVSGSLPFALWITYWVKGLDVRETGSGHASTTNTIRIVGWGWGIIVFILDVGKGFLPTYLAILYKQPSWIIALTVALAVAGHCWPIFAQFRGGMGLATTGGAFLAVSPLGFLIGVAVLLTFVLTLHHAARGSLLSGLLIPPVLWVLGQSGDILWVAAATGIIIALRFTVDWNREYRELWLDREK
jgi:glycerol-3-phosphate acyltransferase PlsY